MEIGNVRQIDIDTEMRGAYLDYAMSVITARALPDVRDGLKPVQRRILYAMGEMGVRHNTPYRKCARIVGDVLGRYHPHGDAAVYEALVRMAQDFSMRHPLVDGQGNFGSVDGDPPAAMRYTECRLTAVAEEMLLDIDKETVDFSDNFDATLKEPTVLPAKLPNLILNGAAGIAVGMATNIPPHNLREIVDAICFLIDHPEATVEDLGNIVLGPDFPTGGIIMGLEGIKSAYATGRGRILVRAKAYIEDAKGERQNIIVTELPYQVNKAALQERIAELVKDGRIEGIGDLRDESDRHGMRVVMELKKGAEGRTILNLLYKYTAMQSTFGVNLLALVDGEPRVLTLKRILQHHIDYRHQVITRRIRFDLAKARAREHILEGLKIALDHLDEVIATIRQSPDADTAKTRLIKRFKLDDIQAQAILDMQLRRLARLERDKIEQELKEIRKNIASLEDLLAHPKKIYGLIKADLQELRDRFGDDRRTRILEQEAQEFKAEDLIPDEDMVIALTQKGYLKRYRLPRRQPKSTVSTETDPERDACIANMHDGILFVTDNGRVCQARCHEVPEADRSARGTPVGNLITLEAKETVVSLVTLPRDVPADSTLAMVTRGGKIKRVAATEFSTVRGSGISGIALESEDRLLAARPAAPGQEFVLLTRQGQAIRFGQDGVRVMGRQAAGVAAVRLGGKGDAVAAFDMAPVEKDREATSLLVVSESGMAKRTALADLPTQGRGGGGLAFVKVTPKTGSLAGARVVAPGQEVSLSTSDGRVWRGPAESIAVKGRTQSLDPLTDLKMAKGEVVVSLSVGRLEGETRGRPETPKSKTPRSKTPARDEPAQGSEPKIQAGPLEAESETAHVAPKGRVKKAPAAPPEAAAAKPEKLSPRSKTKVSATGSPSAPAADTAPVAAARQPRGKAAAVKATAARPAPDMPVAPAEKVEMKKRASTRTAVAPAPPAQPAKPAGKRVLPKPPATPVGPVGPTEPRVLPKAPAEQMALPLNGAASAPKSAVARPKVRKAPPQGSPAPVKKAAVTPPSPSKPAAPAVPASLTGKQKKAGVAKPPAAATTKAVKATPAKPTDSHATKGAAPSARQSPKAAPSGTEPKPAAKRSAGVKETKGRPAAAAEKPPLVSDKPAGPDDILIRSRGGRVGWMHREK